MCNRTYLPCIYKTLFHEARVNQLADRLAVWNDLKVLLETKCVTLQRIAHSEFFELFDDHGEQLACRHFGFHAHRLVVNVSSEWDILK